MGAFAFDYTRPANAAAARASPPEKAVPVVRLDKRPPVREARAETPPVEPHAVVTGVPRALAVVPKGSGTVVFRLNDARSENGTGYLSVPSGSVRQSGNGLSVDLGTASRPGGTYGVVKNGKLVRVHDGTGSVKDRLEADARSAARRESAGRISVPDEVREKGDKAWQRA